MTTIDPRELVDRYVAVWNEPDAELRRKAIHELWTQDGAHIVPAAPGDPHGRHRAGLHLHHARSPRT